MIKNINFYKFKIPYQCQRLLIKFTWYWHLIVSVVDGTEYRKTTSLLVFEALINPTQEAIIHSISSPGNGTGKIEEEKRAARQSWTLFRTAVIPLANKTGK